MNDISKVTRFEIIDHSPCEQCNGERFVQDGHEKPKECPECHGMGSPGRNLMFWDAYKQVEASIQDDGKTLKIFISNRED